MTVGRSCVPVADIGYHANHSAVGYYNGANPNGEPTTNAAAGMMQTPTLDQLASEGRSENPIETCGHRSCHDQS